MLLPALVLLGGLPMQLAVGTSLLVVMMKSIAGLLGYILKFGGPTFVALNPATEFNWSVILTITAKAPRLADRLEEIATSIAAVLEMPSEAVSVKASTGNLIGDEGAGRAIRCQALLLAEHMPS